MCGRYVIVSKIEKIEKRFQVDGSKIASQLKANFNIAPGDFSAIITQEQPKELSWYRFGLQPFWAKKPMYLINARSEGDKNVENDVHYSGRMGILDKPSFRKPIRSQRCLVIADAFIEGTTKEKLSKPYLVYPIHRDFRPFAFAGIYDRWVDQENGEVIDSFSIITSVSTNLLQQIPHHRSPVVLENPKEEAIWLDKNSSLADISNLLRPCQEEFNAYPIDPVIKNPRLKEKNLIEPIGDPILKEYDYQIKKNTQLFGMGMSPGRKRKLDE